MWLNNQEEVNLEGRQFNLQLFLQENNVWLGVNIPSLNYQSDLLMVLRTRDYQQLMVDIMILRSGQLHLLAYSEDRRRLWDASN